jgi:hypothetical protein
LIDFLGVNQDLIEAAAAASEPLPARPRRKQLDKWVRALPEQDKNRVLTTALLQSGDNWKNETLHRFHLENRLVNSSPKKLQFRTVGDLRAERKLVDNAGL